MLKQLISTPNEYRKPYYIIKRNGVIDIYHKDYYRTGGEMKCIPKHNKQDTEEGQRNVNNVENSPKKP